MTQPRIDGPRYAQGLAAYRAGHGLPHLFDIRAEVEEAFRRAKEHATAHTTTAKDHADAWETRENAMPSLIAGFADGALEDLRLIANALRSTRPGERA